MLVVVHACSVLIPKLIGLKYSRKLRIMAFTSVKTVYTKKKHFFMTAHNLVGYAYNRASDNRTLVCQLNPMRVRTDIVVLSLKLHRRENTLG